MSSSKIYTYDVAWDKTFSLTSMVFIKFATDLLVELKYSPDMSEYIARVLCETLQGNVKRYHTNAYHILSIFSFVERHKIQLTQSQKLALLFHDAIYDLDSGSPEENKTRSIKFMDSLLGKKGNVLGAKRCIAGTAYHCNPEPLKGILNYDINNEVELVMDLDLCFFAFPFSLFHNMNLFLMRESTFPKDEFMKRRVMKVDMLFSNKYHPFRTKEFQPFQEIALFNERKLREEW